MMEIVKSQTVAWLPMKKSARRACCRFHQCDLSHVEARLLVMSNLNITGISRGERHQAEPLLDEHVFFYIFVDSLFSAASDRR